MPSATYALMKGWFQESAAQRGPMNLAAEREQAAALADMYREIPSVVVEPAGELRAGSYLLTPAGARDDLVVLFIHGGGFRSGLARGSRGLGAHLALATKARVLLPEYRLAPEDPYPAGLDDCLAAFDHAASLAPRIVVAGESAGANLALAVMLRRLSENRPGILAGVLYAGVFDLRTERFSEGSWTDNADTDPLLPDELGQAMHDDYLAGHRADDPLVSPVVADLRGLPPLFLQVSGAERLLDDSLTVADRAARAGVEVELEVWPKMFHVWQAGVGFLPEATEAVARTAAFVRRVADGRFVDGPALLGGPASLEEVL
ncbi:alpha/beta hydrolase [Streptomyces sp. VNUA24]|uniref:alpha/beta hydrolase n=1 Tax=Streptomyces sp. VNUA24 TaxID=3031131 RepID=UPI0023B7955F|nr:alpha/beta hydrolase [Streptomyces sp. VNUA24]WEH13058.1 alpha/beta hydrolase [Streptomyces sp. VNUA24]